MKRTHIIVLVILTVVLLLLWLTLGVRDIIRLEEEDLPVSDITDTALMDVLLYPPNSSDKETLELWDEFLYSVKKGDIVLHEKGVETIEERTTNPNHAETIFSWEEVKIWEQTPIDMSMVFALGDSICIGDIESNWGLIPQSKLKKVLQMLVKPSLRPFYLEARPIERCPICNTKLIWIPYDSPGWTWEMLSGRRGYLSICPKHGHQVQFLCTMMN